MSTPTDVPRIWLDSHIVTLLGIFQTFPELWNQNIPDYKDQEKKLLAWKKIAERFETTPQEVKRKISNLRTQFSAQVKKINKRSVDGSTSNATLTSEWKFFEAMKFLLGINNVSRASTDTIIYNVDQLDSNDEDGPSTSNCKMSMMVDQDTSMDFNTSNRPTDGDHTIFSQTVAASLNSLNARNAIRLKSIIMRAIAQVTDEQFNFTS